MKHDTMLHCQVAVDELYPEKPDADADAYVQDLAIREACRNGYLTSDRDARDAVALALGLGRGPLRNGKAIGFSWAILLGAVRALSEDQS